MNLEQFGRAIARKAQAIEANLRSAEDATAEEIKTEFVKLSSGPYSLRQLADMGHPYAKRINSRRLTTYLDPTVINVQSGRFRRSWGKMRCRKAGGSLLASVVNSSPEAAFMLGTTKMMPRRIDIRVADAIRRIRFARLRTAVNKGLRA